MTHEEELFQTSVVFRQAVEIAHREFWLADSPDVVDAAWRKVQERDRDLEEPLAYYVAVICKAAVDAEKTS